MEKGKGKLGDISQLCHRGGITGSLQFLARIVMQTVSKTTYPKQRVVIQASQTYDEN